MTDVVLGYASSCARQLLKQNIGSFTNLANSGYNKHETAGALPAHTNTPQINTVASSDINSAVMSAPQISNKLTHAQKCVAEIHVGRHVFTLRTLPALSECASGTDSHGLGTY